MLLGSEYELLSHVSSIYKRHKDGYLRFSEEDFKRHFPEKESQVYLRKLGNKELITFKDGFIFVDTIKWAEFFSIKLCNCLREIDKSISCEFNRELDTIDITKDKSAKVTLTVKYNEEEVDKEKDVISMFFSSAPDDELFWLDLLNDSNLINLLYSYINREVSSLNYKHRLVFSFFEGIEEEYISEIFNRSIKKYFIQGNGLPSNLSIETMEILGKYMCKEHLNAYQVRIKDVDLIIVKNERNIEFYVFDEDKLEYPNEIILEINKLQKRLQDKISDYRKLTLFIRNKVVENSTKLITLIAVIFSPLSMILCALTILGFKFINDVQNNIYVVGVAGIVLLGLYFGIFKFIYWPAIKLSKFSWEISYR